MEKQKLRCAHTVGAVRCWFLSALLSDQVPTPLPFNIPYLISSLLVVDPACWREVRRSLLSAVLGPALEVIFE